MHASSYLNAFNALIEACIVCGAGHYYGGRSYYAVGGYGYYGGYRPYSYFYGPSVILWGYPFYAIGYRSYGCYSCCRYQGTCGGCDSRKSCGQEATMSSPANLDRYEIDVPFTTPGEGSDQWPLTLRIYNATQFLQQGVSIGCTGGCSTTSQQLYFSFYTADGDAMSTAQSWLMPIGWIGAVITLIMMVCFKRSFFRTDGVVIRQQSGVQVPAGRSMPYATNSPQPYGLSAGQQVYAQPSMPVASPYPGQSSMPVAYPSNAMPTLRRKPLPHSHSVPLQPALAPAGPGGARRGEG